MNDTPPPSRARRALDATRALHADIAAPRPPELVDRGAWLALLVTAVAIVVQHDIASPRARDMSLIRGGLDDITLRLPRAFLYAGLAQIALFGVATVAILAARREQLRDLLSGRPSLRAPLVLTGAFIGLAPLISLVPVLFSPDYHPRHGLLLYHTWDTASFLAHAGVLLLYALTLELFYRGALLGALRDLAPEHAALLCGLIYALASFDAHWSLSLGAFFEGWLLAIVATRWGSPVPGAILVWLLALTHDHAWLGVVRG